MEDGWWWRNYSTKKIFNLDFEWRYYYVHEKKNFNRRQTNLSSLR